MGSIGIVGNNEQLATALMWTFCLGATAATIWVSTTWWRGNGKNRGGGKALLRSPGVRVVRVQDKSSGPNGLGSWGGSMEGRAGDGKDGASKWEQSKQKGDLGYYFAHHITMKELAPEDYTMNGPRLLSKTPAVPQGDAAATNSSDSGSTSPPPPRQRAQQISSYSWEDYGEEVRLTFRQSGWEWKKVEEEEISVEWGPRRFRLSIDSREYGLHTMDLPRLNGNVADIRVLKRRSSLLVALIKGGQGSYSKKAPWDKLQAAPEKPTDS